MNNPSEIRREGLRLDGDLLLQINKYMEGNGDRYVLSDIFGAALMMLQEVPNDVILSETKEANSACTNNDCCAFRLVRWLTDGSGSIKKNVIVKTNGIEMTMRSGTILRYLPPNIIEFSRKLIKVKIDIYPDTMIYCVYGNKEALDVEGIEKVKLQDIKIEIV